MIWGLELHQPSRLLPRKTSCSAPFNPHWHSRLPLGCKERLSTLPARVGKRWTLAKSSRVNVMAPPSWPVSSLQKVTYPYSDVAGDSRGQKGFTFHHRDSQRFCQVLTKLFRRKTRTRLGFSFVSVLLWVQAPELAAASLSNDTREKGHSCCHPCWHILFL